MNYDNLILCSTEPYPEIVDAKPNAMIVNILKDLTSGRVGEYTAITQYTYQHIVSADQSKDISKVLEEISITEMRHLELLSKAIVSFGGKPIFQDGRGNYFTSAYTNYSARLIDMLRANIRGETRAIYEYERAIERVDNASLKSLLRRIIADEQCHLKVFEEFERTIDFFGK